ncbi:MAG: universal stress protein [Leptolyngbyaceae cyanobacterium bins.302]|nr:universal stress protein [Leptolyngbyaceae cyanobacterium bins.302]
MFQRILVAITPSKTARYQFETALNLATCKTSLMLLHVLFSETENDLEIPELLSVHRFLKRSGKLGNNPRGEQDIANAGLELLQLQTEIANAVGISTEYAQVPGIPSLAICDFAIIWEADLIIIGKEKHSDSQECFPTNTSNYVTRYAPCSVLTVQSPLEGHVPTIYAQQHNYAARSRFN